MFFLLSSFGKQGGGEGSRGEERRGERSGRHRESVVLAWMSKIGSGTLTADGNVSWDILENDLAIREPNVCSCPLAR